MAENNLRQKTIASMSWNAIQRFGTMLLSFVSNLVLARLLLPEDFGCIGMLTIFIALSEAFIDGGFGAALIQKQDTTQKDFSTIFYWNLFVSFLFFIIMMVSAPLIADFYHMPSLCKVLRGMSCVLLINGFLVIQTTILTKKLEFKSLAKINLIGTLAGVIISIIAAYLGMGVWSLVIKTLITSIVTGIMLWTINSWRPTLEFSWTSFKSLFNFGGLMLLSSLLNTLFENIQGLVIGRVYTATDMGYYSQAKKIDEIPSRSVTQIVTQVSFPVFSKISNDLKMLKNAVKKNVICTNFLIFPLQSLLILLAEPIIIFLFTEKWIESVPYFRILCVYSMFVALNALNTNVLKAVGRSGLYFWIQLIKKVLGISLLLVGLNFGVIGVTWSVSISGMLWWVISAVVNKKVVDYGLWEQFLDILPSLVISLLSAMAVFAITLLGIAPILEILLAVIAYVIVYLILSRLFNKMPFSTYLEILKEWTLKYKTTRQ
jgi:O-antigen/teichoic acid export membrane protein